MEPTTVPRHIVKPDEYIKQWGAPRGVSEEEVGTIEGLMGETQMAGTTVTTVKCYWKPRPAELALLMKGQPIEVEFITPVLMPHLLTVVKENDNAISGPSSDPWNESAESVPPAESDREGEVQPTGDELDQRDS